MGPVTKAGGLAALYIAAAYSAAIPYFVVVVDYPAVSDPVEKLALLRAHYGSMYAMHLVVYEAVALALIVLGVALHERTRTVTPVWARLTTALGLTWAALLLASSMVFNYGMGAVIELHREDGDRAVWMWQAIEAVAQGIGGAGGELLGGLWMLALSVTARRAQLFPRGVIGFGAVIGVTGLISIVPAQREAGIVFGVLQIAWFAWVGVLLLRDRHARSEPQTFRAAP
ncbi:MAG: DUF4386 family protein [Gemmatimonadetes bacterium]|nr:DUF4386 family protein [Gemmatimonadota bacterium]